MARRCSSASRSSESQHSSQPGNDVAGEVEHLTAERSVQERKLISLHESHSHGSHDSVVLEDVPMPTFYSEMIAKYQTRILSASPFVRFTQPYLLMRAREQERRLESSPKASGSGHGRGARRGRGLGRKSSGSSNQRWCMGLARRHQGRSWRSSTRCTTRNMMQGDAPATGTQTRHWENYIQESNT